MEPSAVVLEWIEALSIEAASLVVNPSCGIGATPPQRRQRLSLPAERLSQLAHPASLLRYWSSVAAYCCICLRPRGIA